MKHLVTKATKLLFFIIVIGAAYVAMARIGLMYALHPGFATAFFPSSGLATAAILIFGNDVWPGIFLGSMIANLITPVPMLATSVFVSAGIAFGSTLQAVTLAHFLHKLMGVHYLLSLHRNVFIFLGTTVICCSIASTIGMIVLFIGQIITIDTILSNWTTWWVGDMVGIWIFTPLFLSWSQFHVTCTPFKEFEALLLFLTTIAIALFCYGGWIPNGYPVAFTIIPCLLWSTFRFQTPITTFLLALVSLIAVWGTSSGHGPFVIGSENASLLLLQVFIGVITLMTLVLTSLVNALQHNAKALEDLNHKLVQQNRDLQEKNNKS